MSRIGIDLGGTKIEAALLSADGMIGLRRRRPTPKDYGAVIETIRLLVEEIESETGETARIGVGHPGSLSPSTGRIRNANSVWLNNQMLDRDLESALDREVRLANDADCFALSEAVDGAGQGAKIVFGIIIGTGVGGGLVIDGKLLSGAQGIAGEWGHNPLPWPSDDEHPGPTCWCGKTGCIETFLSGPGLESDHERRHGVRLSSQEIFADQSGPGARSAAVYVDRLARGLASVLNVIDANVAVLGGGVSNAPGLAQRVQDRLDRYLFSDVVRTEVRRNRHGDSSGVRGAAWLWPAETA